jgi:hypothetical protein
MYIYMHKKITLCGKVFSYIGTCIHTYIHTYVHIYMYLLSLGTTDPAFYLCSKQVVHESKHRLGVLAGSNHATDLIE